MKRAFDDWKFVALACLTIGAAPFFPEPHIIGKIRWVTSGGRGMQVFDLIDMIVHGTPWLLLLRLIVKTLMYWIGKLFSYIK